MKGKVVGRLRPNKMNEAPIGDARMFEMAEKYVGFGQQMGLPPPGTAIARGGAHPAITAPIVGAPHDEQLETSRGRVKIDIAPAPHRGIGLSCTPPPAADRLGEQKVQ
jgi:hypothetical protein